MASGIKKAVMRHFRVLSLLVLSLAIMLLSVATTDRSEALRFSTYAFELDGSGPLAEVDARFDFQNGGHYLAAYLLPGNYSMKTNMASKVLVNGVTRCDDDSVACAFTLESPSYVRVLFEDKTMVPNGNFRFYFFNHTDIDVRFELGEQYSFAGIYSVHPEGLHSHYAYDRKEVIVQTFGQMERDSVSQYADFDLYTLDNVSHEENERNDWLQDFILVPLVIAFLMLFVSDVIDYAHEYLRKKS